MRECRCRRVGVSGSIFLLGLVTFLIHSYHFINEGSVYQILTGVAPPMSVSVGLMLVGVWVYHSSIEGKYIVRLLGWVIGGAIALAGLGGALLLYQITHGAEMSDAIFMIANWAATGGLGGTIVGYYELQLIETRDELAEEKDILAEQRAGLERQNERLERITQIISHDIRNPLNVAEGRMELAKEREDVSELEPAVDALERMNAIIGDTLEIAQCGEPVDEEEKEVISLEDLAEESWTGVGTVDGELDIIGDIQFSGDLSRLRNVFENLFRNAIEHGGQDVTVTVGLLKDASGIYIEDDGVGIPEDVDVFEAGFTTNTDGTGLGLSIVRDIVTAHGWNVSVTSSANGGARFEITGVSERIT